MMFILFDDTSLLLCCMATISDCSEGCRRRAVCLPRCTRSPRSMHASLRQRRILTGLMIPFTWPTTNETESADGWPDNFVCAYDIVSIVALGSTTCSHLQARCATLLRKPVGPLARL